eukprot:152296_1
MDLVIYPDLSNIDIDYLPFLSFCGFMFFWWFFEIILIRFYGMEQIVKTAANINHNILMVKMTKRLDSNNKYRISARSSVLFSKFVFTIILSILMLSMPFSWYYDHFYLYKYETIIYETYVYIIYYILSFYLYETIMLRQHYKVDISHSTHHWMSIICGVLVRLRFFSPNISLYAITTIAATFPVQFVKWFRAQNAMKYPRYTRILCKYGRIYFIAICIVNVIGQLVFIIYGVFIMKKTAVISGILIIIGIGPLLHDDMRLMKAMKEQSIQRYEDMEEKAPVPVSIIVPTSSSSHVSSGKSNSVIRMSLQAPMK